MVKVKCGPEAQVSGNTLEEISRSQLEGPSVHDGRAVGRHWLRGVVVMKDPEIQHFWVPLASLVRVE